MSVERLPSLHTGVGIAGHAHPSPVAGSVSSDDADHQYLESLMANVAFDIELCGLALHSNASPYEMHYPRLRRSESKQQAIDHLDVVSCWKGISNAQALELTLWERLFQRCLAYQVEDHLRRSIIIQLSKVRDGVEEDELLPFLLRSLPNEQSRLVEINLPNLIHDMIDAFYNDHPSQTAARNFQWSLGSGDLPGFVYNYVATQECFLRTSEGRYVVKVEVVDILQVDATPDKCKPQAEDASMPPLPSYTSTPLSKTSPLRRIPRIHFADWCFLEELRKRRPDSPKKRKASLRSTSYDGTSPVEMVYDEPNACLKRQKLELPGDIDMHAAVVDLQNRRTAVQECKAMLEALDTFRQSVESRSSAKRRPSEVVRRLHEAAAPALELAYATIDKELSDLKDGDCSTSVKENEISVLQEIPVVHEIPVVRPPTPPHFTMESDSSYASASNSASNASDLDTKKSIVGTSSARSLHSAELSQDEIQKNYREFEEAAKRRKTDSTTAPSCDVGDMNFERIFLEDSEVSDGFDEASGLSDDMDGLLMDED